MEVVMTQPYVANISPNQGHLEFGPEISLGKRLLARAITGMQMQ